MAGPPARQVSLQGRHLVVRPGGHHSRPARPERVGYALVGLPCGDAAAAASQGPGREAQKGPEVFRKWVEDGTSLPQAYQSDISHAGSEHWWTVFLRWDQDTASPEVQGQMGEEGQGVGEGSTASWPPRPKPPGPAPSRDPQLTPGRRRPQACQGWG